MFDASFPLSSMLSPVIVLLTRSNGADVRGVDLDNFTQAFMNVSIAYTPIFLESDNFLSYVTLIPWLPQVAGSLLSTDNSTTIIVLNIHANGGGLTPEARKYIDFLDRYSVLTILGTPISPL